MISGGQMRKQLDQIFHHLHGQVSLQTLAVVRGDTERMVNGMRKENRSLLEDNERLAANNLEYSTKLNALNSELGDLRIQIDSLTQKLKGRDHNLGSVERKIDQLTKDVDELEKPQIDLTLFDPEHVQKLFLTSVRGNKDKICDEIRYAIVRIGLRTGHISLAKWAHELSAEDIDGILLAGFRLRSLLMSLIVKNQDLAQKALVEDMRIPFKYDEHRKRLGFWVTARAAKHMFSEHGEVPRDELMPHVTEELRKGELRFDSECIIRTKDEPDGTPSQEVTDGG